MATQRQSVVWIDADGRTRQTLFLASTAGSTIRDKLLAKSNADVLDWFEGDDHSNNSPSPTAAALPSTRDTARLTFVDGSGNQATLTLPAPLSSIFLADEATVDPSQITDIITAATTYLVNSAGNVVTTFLVGTRQGATSVG